MKKLKYGKNILYYIDEKNIKLYDKIKNTCYNIERIFNTYFSPSISMRAT